MLPKIASALARVLDPIKPVERPGQSLTTAKSAEGGDGGYGTLGYDSQEKPAEKEAGNGSNAVPDHPLENGVSPEHPEKRTVSIPFRPGLTQVILDLNRSRPERSAEAAAATYETGAKEQKKNSRLPKGSMLDKKVG